MKSGIIILILLLFLSCGNKNSSVSDSERTDTVAQAAVPAGPYDLKNPDEKFKLPDELTEISGIDVYQKNRLVCVNDEKGKVYIYDVKKDELKEGVDFGKKGDYEGIAVVNDTVYVLSSNGSLHQVTGFGSPEQKTTDFKTSLDEKNDTEGLGFDVSARRLLIACKADPGNNLKGVRTVYAFDLKTMQLVPQPVYTVKLDELKSLLLKSDKGKVVGDEIKSLLEPEKGDVTFQPSEIAIHPVTNEVYMISSVGNLMVIINRSGVVQDVFSLDPNTFKQPEGLCFLENGDMYISDEGRDGKGNILYFKYLGKK